jgi:hypothetical protein
MQQRKAFWVQDPEHNNYYTCASSLEELQENIYLGRYFDAGDFYLIDSHHEWVEFENFNIPTTQKIVINKDEEIIKILEIIYDKTPLFTKEEQETTIQDVLRLLK